MLSFECGKCHHKTFDPTVYVGVDICGGYEEYIVTLITKCSNCGNAEEVDQDGI